MGKAKSVGKTKGMQFRATEEDRENIAAVCDKLRLSFAEHDKTAAIRYGLRLAVRGGIPLVGEVGAGKGQVTKYDDPATVNPIALFGDGELVAYRVRGESMESRGICSGDYVIVRDRPAAGYGEVVVAHIADGWVLKCFDMEAKKLFSGKGKDRWEHQLGPNDKILGVYVGVVRKA